METGFNNIKKAFIIVVILALIGIGAAIVIPMLHNTNEDSKDAIKRLNEKIDSLSKENKKLLEKDTVLTKHIDSLIIASNKEKTKIIYLNNAKNEKIKIVDGFNDNQLDSFFSAKNIKTP